MEGDDIYDGYRHIPLPKLPNLPQLYVDVDVKELTGGNGGAVPTKLETMEAWQSKLIVSDRFIC